MIGMLGIEDGWVLAGYLLCIASAVFCVVYGLATRNKGDEQLALRDIEWARQDHKAEEEEA